MNVLKDGKGSTRVYLQFRLVSIQMHFSLILNLKKKIVQHMLTNDVYNILYKILYAANIAILRKHHRRDVTDDNLKCKTN